MTKRKQAGFKAKTNIKAGGWRSCSAYCDSMHPNNELKNSGCVEGCYQGKLIAEEKYC